VNASAVSRKAEKKLNNEWKDAVMITV